MKPLCIYHASCSDGFAAAWVVNKAFAGEVEFVEGWHGQPPPSDVVGKNVVMVDFSYPKDVMVDMARRARSFVVIDHHITAKPALDGLLAAQAERASTGTPLAPVEVLFDLERSGCGLAWDFFFLGKPRPDLIAAIEDRDLFRFALEGSAEAHAVVTSYPFLMETFSELAAKPFAEIVTEGRPIVRKHHQDVANLVGITRRKMTIGGHEVECCNLPVTMASDAGALLALTNRFGACYSDLPGRRVFSLRSLKDGEDVGAIAQSYGGGGHTNAAGFQVETARLAEMGLL